VYNLTVIYEVINYHEKKIKKKLSTKEWSF